MFSGKLILMEFCLPAVDEDETALTLADTIYAVSFDTGFYIQASTFTIATNLLMYNYYI